MTASALTALVAHRPAVSQQQPDQLLPDQPSARSTHYPPPAYSSDHHPHQHYCHRQPPYHPPLDARPRPHRPLEQTRTCSHCAAAALTIVHERTDVRQYATAYTATRTTDRLQRTKRRKTRSRTANTARSRTGTRQHWVRRPAVQAAVPAVRGRWMMRWK